MAKKHDIISKGPAPFDGKRQDDEQEQYEAMKLLTMATLEQLGVTAKEYAAFLKESGGMSDIRQMAEEAFGFSPLGMGEPEDVHPIGDADKKSLRLKIQMKDVTKPPMWREVVIPADFNFTQLHYAIQAVTGLENCHLWQFQHKAYDPSLQIGIPAKGQFEFGLGDCTHNADETPVTGFLAEKGDKLEYVYDFGDDWIFTVSVLEAMESQGDVAKMTKWKCDPQPIEDCGGVWDYLRLRDVLIDPKSFNKKEKEEMADNLGFESVDDFRAWLEDSLIDPEHVAERLSEIPDKWEDID